VIFAAWIVLALYDAQYRPKFSWILGSFLGLLGVMFIANILGQHPLQSFWSNFERMEGYVTLVHTFMYMVVAGSVLTTQKLWDRYFNTIIGVAVILSLYAFAQLSGNITINQGGWRLDGTLGNSAYMAIYTLFLSFITFFMFLKAKTSGMKYTYGALVLLFVYLLIQTATRGTVLGLIGGSLIMATYMALFAKGYPVVRKTASYGLIAIVAVVALFITFKESAFVQSNPYLERVASISLSEASNRFNIWSMAFEGVKERPLLGWGQGNYNYVFNEYFRPELHGQEAWFDRVHNIVMDWLIAGGVIGLVAYFSILFSAIYYLFVRPLMRPNDESFTVIERGLLLGLLAGYTIHNVFVFDNIVSYIFYGTILAYIHARVATPVTCIQKWKIDSRLIEQVHAPVIALIFAGIIYVVNIPNIQASGDIINAFRSTDPVEMVEWFDQALERNTFGRQEIREQLTQRAQSVIYSKEIPEDVKQMVSARVEEELLKQIQEKPGDARVHVFISAFYRVTNQIDKAREQLAIARTLSPKKQVIIFEQGFVELQAQKFDDALAFFKEAYDLGPQFMDSRVNYALSAVYAGKLGLLDELIQTDDEKRAFAQSQYAVQAMYTAKMYPNLIEMLTLQAEASPNDKQVRTSLAYILNESGDREGAIAVLEKAIEDIPEFTTEATQFITDLRAQTE
jgi:O-antigen ligase/tetratricopeptide (TPR) repeat protein